MRPSQRARMNQLFRSSSLPRLGACFLLALLTTGLFSCSLPNNAFEARDETQMIGDDPVFESLDLVREIPSEALRPSTTPYRVGPGDSLAIEVAEDARTQATATVMPDGMLYYDVAGGIKASGKTLGEISGLLAQMLEKDYPSPVVTVNLADAQSQRFFILGQVTNPGAYPMGKPTTLIEAISLAGGFYSGESYDGNTQNTIDLDRSTLIRDGDLMPVDFRGLIEHGDMNQNVYIRPGDYLYFPSVQHRAVYVLGAVQNPGPVYFDTDPTILSSVAIAGGPREDAIITKALVIRGSLSDPKVATVNLHNIIRGYDADARLVGGDIVWVPNTVFSYLSEYAEAALITASQALAVQGGLSVLGKEFGGANVSIQAGSPR